MTSFFITILRFLRVLASGVKNDKEFKFLLYLIIILLISATIFYQQAEGWNVIDSLYYSTMTMSTVGNTSLVLKSDISKVFTILYTFISIGAFITFAAKTYIILIDNHNKRIDKIKKKL